MARGVVYVCIMYSQRHYVLPVYFCVCVCAFVGPFLLFPFLYFIRFIFSASTLGERMKSRLYAHTHSTIKAAYLCECARACSTWICIFQIRFAF